MRMLSRVVLLLSGTLAMVAGGRYVTFASTLPVEANRPASLIEWPWPLTDPDVNPETRIDRFGNEVEPAVGDYRITPDGALYDHHAPDTEIPRLTPPVV